MLFFIFMNYMLLWMCIINIHNDDDNDKGNKIKFGKINPCSN
jgi:hypothetical protein